MAHNENNKHFHYGLVDIIPQGNNNLRLIIREGKKDEQLGIVEKKRWVLPEEILRRRDAVGFNDRLYKSGFTPQDKPWGFSLKNPYNDQLYLSTMESTLIMMDKYLEIGFEI